MMETPMVRPGEVRGAEPTPRIIAYFRNSAQGNLAIQLVGGFGVPADRLGVTPPERIDGNQGMVLSIPCEDSALSDRVAKLCRDLGAEVHRQRS